MKSGCLAQVIGGICPDFRGGGIICLNIDCIGKQPFCSSLGSILTCPCLDFIKHAYLDSFIVIAESTDQLLGLFFTGHWLGEHTMNENALLKWRTTRLGKNLQNFFPVRVQL